MGMGLFWFMVIGLVAGWLAGQLIRGVGFGLVCDIIVGMIGALIGGYPFSKLGISTGAGLFVSLIAAAVVAVSLLLVVRLIYVMSRIKNLMS